MKWYKGEDQIEPSLHNSFRIEADAQFRTLTITKAMLNHSGRYTCKIEKFAKDAEGETSCELEIEGAVYSSHIWSDIKITYFY